MPLKTAGVRLLLKLSPQSCKVTSLIHERCTPNDAALAICNRVEVPGLILVISLLTCREAAGSLCQYAPHHTDLEVCALHPCLKHWCELSKMTVHANSHIFKVGHVQQYLQVSGCHLVKLMRNPF